MTLNTLSPTIRKNGKTLYACKNNCGNYISRKDNLCIKCSYEKRGIRKHSELPEGTAIYGSHAYYPCANNCGAFVRNKGHICKQCSILEKRQHRKIYTCKICGKQINHKSLRCRECYLKSIKTPNKPKITYPCKKCETPIIKQGYCKTCQDKILLERGERKQAETNKRKEANEKRLNEKTKIAKLQICPNSPDGRHLEIITNNVGVCKFCGRTKDYNRLLKDYLPKIGM